MNEKFYSLPEEKQRKIINAGYRVFSQNSYKKSPMSEIASEAYLLEKMRCGSIDTDEFEREFEEIIEFWKEVYLKKE